MADIARIEERLDRVAAGATAVSDALGGVRFQNMMEVMEFAKLMSISGNAVPPQLQGNPGSCLAVCVQALEWGFSPFSVASMHFEVNKRHAYMSQLIHAVIEKHAPLRQRLRCDYEGENGDMICIVTGHIKGEVDPLIYRSPKVSAIPTKNSPLWKSDPQQQLWYYASRAWCRRYCPDVLLGVYARDELDEHTGADNARDVSEKPDVASRLKGAGKARGFNAEHVERETARTAHDEPTEQVPAQADAGAATGTVESAAPQDSSQGVNSPKPHSETMPAPEGTGEGNPPVGAGASSQSPAAPLGETAGAEGGPQATEPGDSALHGSGASPDRFALPDGWRQSYVEALSRAKKVTDIGKRHTEWFADYGGYAHHKGTADQTTIDAIFKAFQAHFGPAGAEARNVILKELNAI